MRGVLEPNNGRRVSHIQIHPHPNGEAFEPLFRGQYNKMSKNEKAQKEYKNKLLVENKLFPDYYDNGNVNESSTRTIPWYGATLTLLIAQRLRPPSAAQTGRGATFRSRDTHVLQYTYIQCLAKVFGPLELCDLLPHFRLQT